MTIAIHRRWAWLVLAVVCLAYVFSVWRLHPTNFFGMSEDDGIYFSSAKALAEGRGYILPSIPGTPPATKYPILYPLILSLVWRVDPAFPGNIRWAIAITVAFGIWFIAAVFAFLRVLRVFSDVECLALTAFCALHPLVLFYSASVLSDVPFAALALTALVLADKAVRPGGDRRCAALAGMAGGVAVLLRLFGVPVLAGIFVAGVVRRAWREVLITAAWAAPFVLWTGWKMVFPPPVTVPVSGAAASAPGWVQTWAYYTSYSAIYKLSVPNAQIFWEMVQNNALKTLSGPADFFLAPMFVHDSLLGRALVLLVGCATVSGLLRIARVREWPAAYFSVPFYLVLILLWSYADGNNRYLLPYWPLFAAGLWFEVRRLESEIVKQLRYGGAIGQRIAAAFGGMLVFALGCAVAANFAWGARRPIREKSEERARLLKCKLEAYAWLAKNSERDARIIAYEDPSVYLFSGRMTMRPVFFTAAEQFDAARLQDTVAQMNDVPRAIGAEYWLVSVDDFQNEWPEAAAEATQFVSSVAGAELVMRDESRRFRIYSLRCHKMTSNC